MPVAGGRDQVQAVLPGLPVPVDHLELRRLDRPRGPLDRGRAQGGRRLVHEASSCRMTPGAGLPPGGHPRAPRSAGNATPGGPGAQNFPSQDGFRAGSGASRRRQAQGKVRQAPGAVPPGCGPSERRTMTAEREAGPPAFPTSSARSRPRSADSRRVRKKGKKPVIRNGPAFHPPAQFRLRRVPAFHEREPHRRASAGTAGASWLVMSGKDTLTSIAAGTLHTTTPRAGIPLPRPVTEPARHGWARMRRSPISEGVASAFMVLWHVPRSASSARGATVRQPHGRR